MTKRIIVQMRQVGNVKSNLVYIELIDKNEYESKLYIPIEEAKKLRIGQTVELVIK